MINEKEVQLFLKEKGQTYCEQLINRLFSNFQIIDDGTMSIVCPRCGSIHCIKHGRSADGTQRYKCKDCSHTFVFTAGTILYHSHFTKEQWLSFIDYELSNLTLGDEAYYMNVSKTTCFIMRHKLYRAASEIISQQKLSGEVEVDSMYMSINLKGTKPENMPRLSKKRGGSSAYRGISHHKNCVACAIDSNDNMMMKIVGLGPESFEKYESVSDRFDNTDILISDSKACIHQFANHLDADHKSIRPSPVKKNFVTEDGDSLSSVNEMMTEISKLIGVHRGFSTRYSQGYLDFNLLRKQTRYGHKRSERAKAIYDEVIKASSFTTDDIYMTVMPISLKEAYLEYHYGIFENTDQE